MKTVRADVFPRRDLCTSAVDWLLQSRVDDDVSNATAPSSATASNICNEHDTANIDCCDIVQCYSEFSNKIGAYSSCTDAKMLSLPAYAHTEHEHTYTQQRHSVTVDGSTQTDDWPQTNVKYMYNADHNYCSIKLVPANTIDNTITQTNSTCTVSTAPQHDDASDCSSDSDSDSDSEVEYDTDDRSILPQH